MPGGVDPVVLDLDPVLVQLGPLSIRWYGALMAASMAVGLYYFLRYGPQRGIGEDDLYHIAIAGIIGGIVGARLVYVLTNWSDYAPVPLEIIRVDHGGLSFHGAIGGGALGTWLVARRRGIPFDRYADLAVPGIATGIMLVRIGNIFNAEVLGRPAEVLGGARHPAQIYGSLIGVVLLVLHNVLARRRPPEGVLFWTFFLVYSFLRGFFEETFRDNPLYAWGYVNERWGVGFFTLTHLFTPPLLALSWAMLVRARRRAAHAAQEGAAPAPAPGP